MNGLAELKPGISSTPEAGLPGRATSAQWRQRWESSERESAVAKYGAGVEAGAEDKPLQGTAMSWQPPSLRLALSLLFRMASVEEIGWLLFLGW
jgi:hypothetical protein